VSMRIRDSEGTQIDSSNWKTQLSSSSSSTANIFSLRNSSTVALILNSESPYAITKATIDRGSTILVEKELDSTINLEIGDDLTIPINDFVVNIIAPAGYGFNITGISNFYRSFFFSDGNSNTSSVMHLLDESGD